MNRIGIVAARRTPQGRLLGALAGKSAVDLACAAGAAVLTDFGTQQVDQVIIGNVLGAGQGMNIARQIGVRLGVPIDRPAFTVNMMCASGMTAVMLAAQAIQCGAAQTVLCGGTESMSNASYLIERARAGLKLGDGVLVDSLLRDGLVDAFDGKHMGLGAERLAGMYRLSRAEQDAFAARSQSRCAAAMAQGLFAAQMVSMPELAADEHPRPDTTVEKLATLKPGFAPDGTVTAGNASGINDGAALLLVTHEATAKKQGWPVMAWIEGFAGVGCDPATMGLGPAYATRRLCEQLKCSVNDFDAVELNEAFAAQALACIRELKLDEAKVNREGGAIALGHPIGASGARLMVHLAHSISCGDSKRALATLCVGGGMGIAAAMRST